MSEGTAYVTLVSSEGHKFILPRLAALESDFLKDGLQGEFSEGATGIFKLQDLRSEIVEKVVEYLMYKLHYSNTTGTVPDFGDRVEPEIALELLMASDFLQC